MNLRETKVRDYFRINDTQARALKRLRVISLMDLLYHFPSRYGDTAEIKNISSIQSGDHVVLFGKISNLKTKKAFRRKMPMATGTLEDDTGKIQCVWFNQAYIAKMIQEESTVRLEGKVSGKDGKLSISNPKIEKVSKIPNAVGNSIFGNSGKEYQLYPVYSESRGITSNWIFYNIQKIFNSKEFEEIVDPIPVPILKKYNLPTLRTALIWIHSPKTKRDAESARKRFSFEEVFFIQLEKQKNKIEFQKNQSYKIDVLAKDIKSFLDRLPFSLTAAQDKSVKTILKDFKSGSVMSRLLEGDVGSGKTAVAAATVYAVTKSRPKDQDFGNLQTAYMAPTEILAKQHFESFIEYFSYLNINIGLITSSGCRKFPSKIDPTGWTNISRTQLLKWVANGEIPILIGTHALIQKSVKFQDLAYVIIDEQHRFGTRQRQSLATKSDILPHLLSMTATPIPRTLALTIFGDLDLSLLDSMPIGRKPIITEIVLPNEREKTYEKIREELGKGRQVYVICPRIDEPDPNKELALNVKSVKSEAKRLKKDIFKEYEIGILHSKMKDAEKETVMNDFKDGKIHILAATSVVEVGVNVPNATSIIIEGAERFGLSQLHQLRGRVIRSNHQAYCYVFTDTRSDKSIERLTALKSAKNGFELSEFDLKFRGPGQLSGIKQWGVSDIAMEALKNIKMVEAAREEAREILEKDTGLKAFLLIRERLEESDSIHFE